MAKHDLKENQKKILTDLESIIKIIHEQHLASDGKDSKLGFTNAIGIFGSRGAGKSTLLFKLYNDKKNNVITDDLHFFQPIDCSTLAPMTIPSSVVLLSIKKYLEGLISQGDKNKKTIEDMLNKLDVLIGYCTRSDKDYRKLCLELSTSPSDYDHYQGQGIQERLCLKQDLQNWILELRKITGTKTFVILLDDFDLTSVTQVHAWIKGLLDELQQIGLIFVLTADFYRLEHLSWNHEEQCDDKTGRALINKIFPPKNCLSIREWPIKESRKFFFPKKKDLEQLIDDFLIPIPALSKNIILSLLPRLPRGIENLYEFLLDNNNNSGKTKFNALSFASVLATCRNEPLLARLLKERSNRTWLIYLPLNDKSLSPEQWDYLIHKARLRPQKNLVSALKPLPNLLRKPKSVKTKNQDEETKVIVSDEHAPLVHVNDYTAPLRDANHADANLWVELLLDLNLHSNPSQQAYFFTTWKPITDKLRQTQFELTFPSWDLEAFFIDNDTVIQKSSLCWLSNSRNYKVKIGWTPLFDTARGAKNPLSLGLLSKFSVNPQQLQGDLPTVEQLKLLPDRLWMLLVFADALERCPWVTFSRFFNWLLVTYIALAAAFVRSAYMYSLVESGCITEPISTVQQEFLNMLKNRDPSLLLGKTEEQVWDKLTKLFQDTDWQKQLDDTDNLHRIAKNYLESPMYQDVVSLLKHTIEFYS